MGVSNSSDQGIILLKFPTWFFFKKNLRPNDRSAGHELGNFRWAHHTLPDEIEVAWQYATLSDCTNEKYKMGCKFSPIEGQIFKKTIDLRHLKKNDAFKNLGKTSHRGWPNTNTAKLRLIFTGEDVEVSVFGGSTKTWR